MNSLITTMEQEIDVNNMDCDIRLGINVLMGKIMN